MPDGGTGIGAAVKRVEDKRFLTGRGNYTDDINRPGQTYAYILRSPQAHATIDRIDTAAAVAAPGVLAVYTGADMVVGSLPCGWQLHSRDGSPMHEPPHPPLAQGKVRCVGDQVAVVIAETYAQARDAAEAVAHDIDPLPAVTDAKAAAADGAPQLYDATPNNVVLDYFYGDRAAVAEAFEKAAHVTRLDLVSNRVIVSALEPRAAIAE